VVNLLSAIILAGAIAAGGFFIGGRYDSHPAEGRAVVIVDRFTGAARVCDVSGCGVLQERFSN
jgi:hypothetical protein